MRAFAVRRERERFSRKYVETSPSFSALIGRAAAVWAGRWGHSVRPHLVGDVVQNTLIDFPKITKELVKSSFIECLDFTLQFAPAGADEKDIRAKLA